MSFQKDVEQLQKDVKKAIEWTAQEFDYVEKLEKSVAKIKKGSNIKKILKKVGDATLFLRYVGKSERRAFRFQERVEKELENLQDHLPYIIEFKPDNSQPNVDLGKLVQEITIEHDTLVKYAATSKGKLEKILAAIKKNAQLIADLTRKELKGMHGFFIGVFQKGKIWTKYPEAREARRLLFENIKILQKQIESVKKWIGALEGSLRAVEKLIENLTTDKGLIKYGKRLLRSYGVRGDIPDHFAKIAANNYKEIHWVAQKCEHCNILQKKGEGNKNEIFENLIKIADIVTEQTWPYVIVIAKEMGKRSTEYFKYIGAEKMYYDKRDGPVVTIESWPAIVVISKNYRSQRVMNKNAYIASRWLRFRLPADKLEILIEAVKNSNITYYFYHEEVCELFLFMKRIVKLVLDEKITIVYAIDRGGRPLGFLLHAILKNLGITQVERFYFIHTDRSGRVTMYSEKQKEIIHGENILLIDEFAQSGTTIEATKHFLEQFAKKVIPCAFATSSRSAGKYYSQQQTYPSWLHKAFSGMSEKPHGGVYVHKSYEKLEESDYDVRLSSQSHHEFAKDVRIMLLSLGKLIAQYVEWKK